MTVEDWLEDPPLYYGAPRQVPPPKPEPEPDPFEDKASSRIIEANSPPGYTVPLRTALALRELVPTMRLYLLALFETGFVAKEAARLVATRLGRSLSMKTVRSWETKPHFVKARALLADVIPSAIGPKENLHRLNHVIEHAMTPRTQYVNGEPTGETAIDTSSALKGIELAAKINKTLGGDEQTTRVTVNIVDLTSSGGASEIGAVVSEQ